MYAAWLGDSQAVLVRNGRAVKIVEPHKPNRPVSPVTIIIEICHALKMLDFEEALHDTKKKKSICRGVFHKLKNSKWA